MKNLTFKSRFLVLFIGLLTMCVTQVWAEDADYTLTPAKGSNNSYTGNCDVTIGDITWNLTGNSTMIPWRIGGKSITNVDRTVYSKTAYTSAVSKIDLTVGGASSITVNSLKLIYSTNSDFSSSTEISRTFAANSTITFEPVSGNFPADAYYKFVFNVTVSGTSNKFVEFSKVEIYNAAGPACTDPATELSITSAATATIGSPLSLTTTGGNGGSVTWSVTNGTGSATIDGSTLTPATAGTVTVKAHQDLNGTTCAQDAEQTVTISKQAATITLSEAGNESNVSGTHYVGDPYTLPSTTSATCGSKVLVGWSTVEIATPGAKPASNYYDKGASVTLGATNKFYAVFADASGSGGTATGSDLSATTSAQTLEAGKPITYTSSADNAYSDPVRIYKNGTFTIAGATMTRIVMEGNDTSNPATNLVLKSGESGSISTGTNSVTWTGSATSVTFVASSAQARVKTITVTYGNVTYSNYATTCGPATYSASVAGGLTNGTITLSADGSSFGAGPLTNLGSADEFYFRVTPSDCYELNTLTVTDGGSKTYVLDEDYEWNAEHNAYYMLVDNTNIVISATFSQTTYTVTPSLTNVSVSGTAIPANVNCGESFSTTISAAAGYTLPADITVTGGTKSWNAETGALSITNVTGAVSITIVGTATANFTNNEIIFIHAGSSSAWDASACVKAWFHESGNQVQPIYWVFDGSGYKMFAVQVPATGDYSQLQLQRFASNCNDWWNSNGDVYQSARGGKTTVLTNGSGESNVSWHNDLYKIYLQGSTNSWSSAIGELIDQMDGTFKYTISNYAATGTDPEFKLKDSYNHWWGSENYTLTGTRMGSVYNIDAKVDFKQNGPSLYMTKTLVSATVSFDKNGRGDADPAAQAGIAAGGKVTAPTAPTETGYRVTGWYQNAECTGDPWDFDANTVDESFTLYAKWESSAHAIVYVAPTTLTGMGYANGDGAHSIIKSFTISGRNLTSNVTVTAPADFEVSQNGSDFATSQILTASAVLSGATIYVRLASGKGNNSYNGNVTVTGSEFETENVAVSALVADGHTITFVNKRTTHSTRQVADGAEIGSLPVLSGSESCDPINYPVFVGWSAIDFRSTSSAPSLISGSDVISSDVTYYAVFGDLGSHSNTYGKITDISQLSDGNYVIAGKGDSKYYMMKNEILSSYYLNINQTNPTSDAYTSPGKAYVWKLTSSAEGWTMYNDDVSKYVSVVVSGVYNNLELSDDPCYYALTVADGVWSITKTIDDVTRYVTFRNDTYKEFAARLTQENEVYLFKQQIQSESWITSCIGTVTYDANGATSGSVPVDVNEYAVGATVTVLSNTGSLSRTGYTFSGWNTRSDGTGTDYSAVTPLGTFTISGDITLYAKWIPNSCTVNWSVNGEIVSTVAVNYDDKVTALPENPDVICGGKVFVGWRAEAIVGEQDAIPSGLFTDVEGSPAIAGNTTFYAVFAKASAGGATTTTIVTSIEDYAGGNSWGNGSQYSSVVMNSDITAMAASTGSNTGKYYTSDYTWRFYQNEEGTLTIESSSGDISSVTLTFKNADNGTISYNSSILTSETAVAVSGKNVSFTIGASSGTKGKILIQAISVTYAASGTSYSKYATTCLYPIRYACTTTGDVDSYSAKGVTIQIIDDPVEEGYEFRGWTVTTDGGDPVTVNGTSNSYSFTMPADGVCICPTMTPNTITLSYFDQGGAEYSGSNLSDLPTTHTYNTTTVLVAGGTKIGYTFGGWYTTPDCTGEPITEVGPTACASGTYNLYAKWIEAAGTWTITGNVHLTSYNGVTVYTTNNPESRITISGSNLCVGHALRIEYYDGETKITTKSQSLFRVCDGSAYTIAEGNRSISATTYNETVAISYTPNAYGTTNTYKIRFQEVNSAGTQTFGDPIDLMVYGRSLPETFVVAAQYNGQWYALPADLTGSGVSSTKAPYLISVDNPTTPTVATYAPATALYKGAGRNAPTSNRGGIRLQGNANNKYATANNSATGTLLYMPDGNISNYQDWYLTSSDFGAYTIQINPTVENARAMLMNGGTIGYYTTGNTTMYILPVTNVLTDREAEIVEWGQHSAILEVDAVNPTAINKVVARIGATSSDAITLTQTTTSGKGSATKYNYTANFGNTIDFAANEGNVLYLDWKNGDATVGTTSIVIPRIIAANTTMSAISTTKGHWSNANVVVLPGATLTADVTNFAEGTVTIKNLEVYPGATLNVSGGTLTTTNLVLRTGWTRATQKSYDVARVYINNVASLTHTHAYMDCYIDYDQYYPIAVPFPVTTSAITYRNTNSAAVVGSSVMIKSYDGAKRAETVQANTLNGENWVAVTSGTLSPSKGYAITAKRPTGKAFSILRMPLTFTDAWTTSGEKAQVDAVTKNTVTVGKYTSTAVYASGWNFVANPYMAVFNDNDGTGITGAVLYTDPEAGNVRYATIPTEDFMDYYQEPISTAALKPASGFFVQSTQDGTIAFSADKRKSSAPAAVKSAPEEIEAFVRLSSATERDQMGLVIGSQFTADYDFNADLTKIMGEAGTLKTYLTYGGYDLAYVAVPELLAREMIPVVVSLPKEDEYTFSVRETASLSHLEGLYLMDYKEGTVTNLLYKDYTFTSVAGKLTERFALNAVVQSHEMPTGDNGQTIDSNGPNVQKIIYKEHFYIIVDGKVYDGKGSLVNNLK